MKAVRARLAVDRLWLLLSSWMPDGFHAIRGMAVRLPGGTAPVADIVVVQGDLGSFGPEVAAAEVSTVIDRGGAVDYVDAGIPCHWRIELGSGPTIVVRMAGQEERMFPAGVVGLPLMAGREIVVPIDPLMMVPGPR